MLDKVSTPARKRTAKWLGAAAVAALIAGGAVESGLVAPNAAHAELRSMAQPVQNVPSFADVIERVKPAVVAVKVKVQNVADRDDDESGPRFSMPDLPPGHPMERFFRQFRDGERGDRGERGQRGRDVRSDATGAPRTAVRPEGAHRHRAGNRVQPRHRSGWAQDEGRDVHGDRGDLF